MGTLSKLFHYSVDAVLISAVFAGVRRSTGLTFNSNQVENSDIRGLLVRYLGVGEWVLDTSASFLESSKYFKKRTDNHD